jgi:hypothetical protein
VIVLCYRKHDLFTLKCFLICILFCLFLFVVVCKIALTLSSILETALLHTIEFREKYKPWLITPAMVEYAKTGWMYQHGFSKDGSSIVWYRPGLLHKANDPELFIRTVMFTLEYAVVESFIRSGGTIGRYNVVVDCQNFSFSSVPSFGQVRRLVTILQDHFPHRTSFIFLVNLAPAAQLFLKMIRPLLSEVRNLICRCGRYIVKALRMTLPLPE